MTDWQKLKTDYTELQILCQELDDKLNKSQLSETQTITEYTLLKNEHQQLNDAHNKLKLCYDKVLNDTLELEEKLRNIDKDDLKKKNNQIIELKRKINNYKFLLQKLID